MLKVVISLGEVDKILGGKLLKGLGLFHSLHFSLGILTLISNENDLVYPQDHCPNGKVVEKESASFRNTTFCGKRYEKW